MHQRLKERLVGAAVLVVIAVVFIPMLLTGPIDSGAITKTNIPERPADKFSSRLVPITDSIKPVTKVDSEIPAAETGSIDEAEAQDNEVAVTTDKTIESKNTEPVKSTVATTSSNKQVGLSAWVVQLGSFSSKVNADKLNLSLRKSGFPAFVEPLTKDNKTVYRVRVGPELLRADADKLLKQIKNKMKQDGIVLSYP